MGTWCRKKGGKFYIDYFICHKGKGWCDYDFCKDIRRIRHSDCRHCQQWKQHQPKKNAGLMRVKKSKLIRPTPKKKINHKLRR